MAEAQFDQASQSFSDHYGQMRGYVREHVTQENLERSLDLSGHQPMRVLDMEGGAGRDANWLAALGHKVVLIDSSPKQLELAYQQKRLDKATIVQGDIETAIKLYQDTGFHLVLSHGALLYQERPLEYLRKLSQLVRPLGHLSLLTASKFGKINRAKAMGDQKAVDRLLLDGQYINNLGLKATSHTPKELDQLLMAAGLKSQRWFGVRVNSDNDSRAVEEVAVFHRNRLIDDELRLSHDPKRKAEGQLIHFIAQKLN